MDSLTIRLANALERVLTVSRYPEVFTPAERYNIQHEASMAYHAFNARIDQEVEQSKPVGICPGCKQTVFQSDDTVWTCPCGLSPTNPYWEPSPITDDEQEKAGIYSRCPEDFGGYCGNHLPLHSACYDKGNY